MDRRTLQPVPIKEVCFLREVYETLGPTARGCYAIRNREDLAARVNAIESACRRLPFETILNLINKEQITDASQKVIIMWSKDDTREESTYKFASATIARIYCEMWHIKPNEELLLEPFTNL